ncbi:hypothetical protein [Saccharolobus islandicus]|uniref:Uncharacterized protein n=1 Tax=Saccharolobus islandicus (strain L.D.8.5 / Lassen \|nr:hypothetical protein [Sulfolobus islandicus]ADB86561.1 conserved hypothetical protein [Sulfolobus islandicus L.D.8.5]
MELVNQNGVQEGGHFSNYIDFVPQDQQHNDNYEQYGIFWLYTWFTESGGNIYTYFMMNGNIYGASLPMQEYKWTSGLLSYSVNAILAEPPSYYNNNYAPFFAISYDSAYGTGLVGNTKNLYVDLANYQSYSINDLTGTFVPGTFGYFEQYTPSNGNKLTVSFLQDDASLYIGTPYLFISAGSGGGSGYMYLDWAIATYGVPYVINVPS